jgi:ankyrin repeat protein
MKTTRFILIGVAAAIFLLGLSKMMNRGSEDSKPKSEPKVILPDETTKAAVTPVMTAFQKGMRPIHAACRSGDVATVSFIIEHGADIHARTMEGWSPMHFAAASGSLPVVKLLIDNGCSVKDVTIDGVSVLTIAAATGNAALVEFIVQQGANVRN